MGPLIPSNHPKTEQETSRSTRLPLIKCIEKLETDLDRLGEEISFYNFVLFFYALCCLHKNRMVVHQALRQNTDELENIRERLEGIYNSVAFQELKKNPPNLHAASELQFIISFFEDKN